jgi:hypothetical protein
MDRMAAAGWVRLATIGKCFMITGGYAFNEG